MSLKPESVNYVLLSDQILIQHPDNPEHFKVIKDPDEKSHSYTIRVYKRSQQSWESIEYPRSLFKKVWSCHVVALCTTCGYLHHYDNNGGDTEKFLKSLSTTCPDCKHDTVFYGGNVLSKLNHHALPVDDLNELHSILNLKLDNSIQSTETTSSIQPPCTETSQMSTLNRVSKRASESVKLAAQLSAADAAGDMILNTISPYLPESLRVDQLSDREREFAKIACALLVTSLAETGVIPVSHASLALRAADLSLTASSMRVIDPLVRTLTKNLEGLRDQIESSVDEIQR